MAVRTHLLVPVGLVTAMSAGHRLHPRRRLWDLRPAEPRAREHLRRQLRREEDPPARPRIARAPAAPGRRARPLLRQRARAVRGQRRGPRRRQRGPAEYCKISPLVVRGRHRLHVQQPARRRPSSSSCASGPTTPAVRGLRLEDPDPRDAGADHPLQRRRPARRLPSPTWSLGGQPRVHRQPRGRAVIPFDHTYYEDPATNPCNDARSTAPGAPRRCAIGPPDARVQLVPRHHHPRQRRRLRLHQPGDRPRHLLQRVRLAARDQGRQVRRRRRRPSAHAELTRRAARQRRNRVRRGRTGDPYVQCAGFVAAVDRGPRAAQLRRTTGRATRRGSRLRARVLPVPRYDRLRETHPDLRPPWIENRNASCERTADCPDEPRPAGHGVHRREERPGLPIPSATPSAPAACAGPAWFVACKRRPGHHRGPRGFCIDARSRQRPAGACLAARTDFEGQCDTAAGTVGTSARARDWRCATAPTVTVRSRPTSAARTRSAPASTRATPAAGAGLAARRATIATSTSRSRRATASARTIRPPNCTALVDELCTTTAAARSARSDAGSTRSRSSIAPAG